MFRVRWDPFWLLVLLVPIAIWGVLAYPKYRAFWVAAVVALGLVVALRLLFEAIKARHPAPVPDSAVRELLQRCTGDDRYERWVLVRFRPGLTLEEARIRAGSASYADEDRLEGFMAKFHAIEPSRPDIAIFYSPNRGLLLGRVPTLRALEHRYGRWLLDTWHTLVGALRRGGLTVLDLDSPQLFFGGQHIGSADEWGG